jgi:hypothetical protein
MTIVTVTSTQQSSWRQAALAWLASFKVYTQPAVARRFTFTFGFRHVVILVK